ncbi:MAG: type IV secretion system DNA-binding domain-containing protein, partial [Terriglobia bacterium]
MSREWGRESYAGEWPSRKPVGIILALVVALASTALIEVIQYQRVWPFAQRFYLPLYLQTGFAGTLRKQRYYTLLTVVNRRGMPLLPLADELAPVTLPSGQPGERLTQEAVNRGAVRLEWQRGFYNNAQLHAQIRRFIFEDQSWWDLVNRACYGGLIIFVLGVIVAIPGERRRSHILKHGRRLRGPELVTPSEFNPRNRADGVGFVNQERTFGEMIFGQGRMVRIPREEESFHILAMGDTGMGKSALIRQILMQVEDRDEAAIVYDPALEYTPQFYKPERGDVILNPLDQRMPYWKPGEEVRHDAEALTLAASLYPDLPGKDRFFTRGPREVFAQLLTFKPGPEELAHWMCHD